MLKRGAGAPAQDVPPPKNTQRTCNIWQANPEGQRVDGNRQYTLRKRAFDVCIKQVCLPAQIDQNPSTDWNLSDALMD
eukprot:116365-Chlamydomonas_euryale.AAC.1